MPVKKIGRAKTQSKNKINKFFFTRLKYLRYVIAIKKKINGGKPLKNVSKQNKFITLKVNKKNDSNTQWWMRKNKTKRSWQD